jgi:hypothetical protein
MLQIYNDDSWMVGHSEANGFPVVIRARHALPSQADRELYPNLVVVTWPYEPANMGMPSPQDSAAMNRFEDALEQSVELGVGVQAASITGNGVRAWRYYTSSQDEFMSEFNRGLAGHPAYPLELRVFSDPDWSALAELQPERA